MDRFTRDELFSLLGMKAAKPRLDTANTDSETGLEEGNSCAIQEKSETDHSLLAVDARNQGHSHGISDYEPMSLASADIFIQKKAPIKTTGWKSEEAHAHHVLTHSVPRIWRYTLTHCESKDARSLRKKLRELLVWVYTKEGFKTVAPAPAPYQIGGRAVAGRIDLMVLNKLDKPILAIEADWSKDSTSICKLKNLASKDIVAAWIIGADVVPEDLSSWRNFADVVSGKSSKPWLRLIHLEHGLV